MHSLVTCFLLAILATQAAAFSVLPASSVSPAFRPAASLLRQTRAVSAHAVGLRAGRQLHQRQQGVINMSGGQGSCTAVLVYIQCKPGTEDAFKTASLANAQASVQEEGIARFDCIQNQEDPSKFVLVEVYKSGDAPAAHKDTAHYATWRDAVADMMAVPRSAKKYSNIFPAESAGWDVPAALGSGAAESGKDELLAVHVFVSVKPGTEDAFKAASLDNAQNSVKEPGVARFDVLQNVEDTTKFLLVEVYSNADAPAAHKETAHYAQWRDTVADMMAEPRSALKYSSCFPFEDANWRMSKL